MPRLRFFSLLSLVALAAAVATGCDHTTTIDGPRLIDRFGEFALLEPLAADRQSVDFAAGQAVTFTAAFNKQTNWVLEIVGEESGAVKQIEGFSDALNAENARWSGSTTELPLFKEEAVTASLFFPEEEDTDTTRADVAVSAPPTYPGNVVAAFEGNDNIELGNFEFELQDPGISDEVPPGQGSGFYLLRGQEPPSGSTRNFFVGLIEVLPTGGRDYHAVPTTIPEELYLNFFLYGFGTPNTIAIVQVIADANGNGQFDDGVDSVFPIEQIPADFTGWQPFSTPLSELGVTQEQAGEVVNVRVLLISDDANQPATPLPVEYGIDYITFTAGGPLNL